MKSKRNGIVHLITLCILCVGFVLCRFVFFNLHGMYELPLVLFLISLLVLAGSFFAKAKWVPVLTALAYPASFAAGVIFQTDGVDPGGGGTNNLWIIWMIVFVGIVLASVVMEWIAAKKNKRKAAEILA